VTFNGDELWAIVGMMRGILLTMMRSAKKPGGQPGELQLRFYAYLGLPGVAPGGVEERRAQVVLDSDDRG